MTKNVIFMLLNGSTDIQPLLEIIDIDYINSLRTISSEFHITLFYRMHQHQNLLSIAYIGKVAYEDIQVDSIITVKKVAYIVFHHSS